MHGRMRHSFIETSRTRDAHRCAQVTHARASTEGERTSAGSKPLHRTIAFAFIFKGKVMRQAWGCPRRVTRGRFCAYCWKADPGPRPATPKNFNTKEARMHLPRGARFAL